MKITITDIYNIFNDIKIENSTNSKMDILESYMNTEYENILTNIIHKTYDKRINKYYMDNKKLEQIFNIKEIETKIVPEIGDDIINYPKEGNEIELLNEVLEKITNISNAKKLKNRISGDKAIEYIKTLIEPLNDYGKYIIYRILSNDLKIGMNVKNFNKVLNNKIYQTPYHGAEPLKLNKLEKNLDKYQTMIVDEKLDGMYAAIGYNYSESRSGKNLYIDYIFDSLPKNDILIGELLLKNEPDRKKANGIINSYTSNLEKLDDFGINYEKNLTIENNSIKEIQELLNQNLSKREISILKKLEKDILQFEENYNISFNEVKNQINYIVWDIIPKEDYEKGEFSKALIKRRIYLQKKIKNNNNIQIVNYIATNKKIEIAKFLHQILEKGGEGIIIKNPDAEFKTTKSNQMKVKIEITVDLKIVGFKQGKKGSKFENTLGSLEVISSDGKLRTFPAGIDEKLRDEIWNNKEKYLGKIIEVKANGLTIAKDKAEYALQHPAFMEIRNDKIKADSLEDIKNNFNMAQQVRNLLNLNDENLSFDLK